MPYANFGLVRRYVVSTLLLSATLATPALAQTGVSDERVSLPDGPGSIGGIGENVSVNAGMGMMSFAVPIQVPQGIAAATPDIDLAYNSGSGQGLAGIGWDLDMPRIERATFRGVPQYDDGDIFAVDGSDELVRTGASGDDAIYRARFEGGFVRYRWVARGAGTAGYWKAEYPDGRVGYFGADVAGTLVPSARATAPEGGVFAYHLVALVTPWGHRVTYSYVKAGETPLIDTISYAYDGATPRFVVSFVYESRQDVVSDAKPGFDMQLEQRVVAIRVASKGQEVRRYELSYEDYEEAGGSTRLSNVTEVGQNGVVHPNSFSFTYSRALGGACDTNCEKPFVVDMGTLPDGVDISTGRATLIDINGDSLPDVLNSTADGAHTFYISKLSSEGHPSFTGDSTVSTSTEGGSPFTLGAPGVQVLDVNGDGFADIVASRTPAVLCNDGSGDWNGEACLMDATLPVLDEDEPGEADPRNVRFLDYDNNKRIDMIRTTAGLTEVFVNDGEKFTSETVDEIGAVFDESTLQLADMNGDGLNDPVEILNGGVVRYRLNLGYGRWTDWVEVTLEEFDETALLGADLEDVNGDGLADVVVVAGNEIQYAINRNANRFEAVVTVGPDEVEGDLPERTSATTVTYADMNGNGTDDVVWITSSGNVTFLEMFPVRPNLLSQIDNGIGWIQDITYGTSIAEQARDDEADEAWKYRLPTAMTVVKTVDDWVTVSASQSGGLHQLEAYDYHHGYYDGIEKKFRGFERVERTGLSDEDDNQEPGRSIMSFDVGKQDIYYAGLPTRTQIFGGEGFDRALQEVRYTYDDCPLDVPEEGLSRPVRHVCQTEMTTVAQEGKPEDEWATTRTEMVYDAFGNVTKVSDLGVVHMGPPGSEQACAPCTEASAPCGDDCLGDESFTETEYVQPGEDTSDAWILGKPSRELTYGDAEGPREEVQTFYDGPSFEGLPAGKLTRGSITRIMERDKAGDGGFVAIERYAYDDNGNVVESLDALGDPDATSGHRRRYEYTPSGIDLISTEILLSDAEGEYSLRREIGYDEAYSQIAEATNWMLVRGGDTETPRNSTRYRYDEHGRLTKVLLDGDMDASPARELIYDLGDPASRIIRRGYSRRGEDRDIEEITCLDGRGREFQTRTLIEGDRYQVSGFTEWNSRGQPVRTYQPYQATSGDCDMMAPEGVPYTSFTYDFLGREIEVRLPDDGIYDTPSVTRTVYEPLATVAYDEEDTDSESAHKDTPTRVRVDGLGRAIAVDRFLEAGGEPATLRIEYDSLGRLVAYEDPAGNRREQTFDLSGEVLSVEDPNAGTTTFTYDEQGNRLSKTDAEGLVTRYAYDGDNRLAAQWDGADEEGTRVELSYDTAADCEECSNVSGTLAEVRFPLKAEGVSGTGIDRFGYDGRSQLVYMERVLEGHSFVTRAEYDNEGRATLKEFPDGQRIERSYDGMGRLVTIGGLVEDTSYDARGNLASMSFANGVTTAYEYDDVQRLSKLSTSRGDDKLIAFAFTRDRADNILTTADEASERAGRIGYGAEYTYDAWYRLLEGTFDADAAEPETVTSKYSAIDNIVSRVSSLSGSPADKGDYEYDANKPNAVTKAGSTELSYDEAGRAKSRGPAELAWDYQSRLVRATRDEKVAGEFVYGSGAERVMKLERGGVVYYIQPDFEVRDGIGVVRPQALGGVVARVQSDALQTELLTDVAPIDDEDGAITAADAWVAHAAAEELIEFSGDDPSPAERLLKAAARHALFEAGGNRVFLHHDEANSLILATDEEGKVLGERAFYPGGELRAEQGYVDEYGYTGQERDESTGLLHFQQRYLDPGSSRWLSPDPKFAIATPGTITGGVSAFAGYAYSDNNAINVIDLTGLDGTKAQGSGKLARSKSSGSLGSKKPAQSSGGRQRSGSAGSKTQSTGKAASGKPSADSGSQAKVTRSGSWTSGTKPTTPPKNAKPSTRQRSNSTPPSSGAKAPTSASGGGSSSGGGPASTTGGGSASASPSSGTGLGAAMSGAGGGAAASPGASAQNPKQPPKRMNKTQKRDVALAIGAVAIGMVGTALSAADIGTDDKPTGDALDESGLAFDVVGMAADAAAMGFMMHAMASKDKGQTNNSQAPSGSQKSSRKKGNP